MKMKYSSFAKMRKNFNIFVSMIVLFFFSVFTVLQFLFMDDIYAIRARHNMTETADKIIEVFTTYDDYRSKISDYEAENSIYVEIYKPRDMLVYTTESNNSIYEPTQATDTDHVLKPRIMKILSRTQRKDNSYFEIRQEYFATAQYIVYGNFYGGDIAIEVYYPLDVIAENAETASQTILALSIFSVVLMGISAFLYASYLTKPLKQITDSTRKIASMNFEEKCPEFGIKDLNELSKGINTLSDSLNCALTSLKEKNQQLERSIEKELILEKQRKSFVASVSHELKTPISIIRGYAEGMKYGIGCDSVEEFSDIIIDEADKMNNLVLKLMELIQYGENYTLNISTFNLKQTVSDYLHLFAQNINDNHIDLEINIDCSYAAKADKDLFINVLNNYITNALNHIDGDKKLIITTVSENDKYRISVFNSGKPIPGSDIENIWQSFYRADKSRSRKDGHFGLGLSIVATMQDLHKEKYGVINHEDGVEFWFDVKKA